MKLQGLVKVCAAMLCCLCSQQLLAQQLKLGTNPTLLKPSALLELESTKQALLITRIADTSLITSPINGMIIYLTTDNSFRVRANNYWNKLIPEGGAIKSINNDFTPTQNITASYTPVGTFGFTTTSGTHTLTIPDAGLTAAGFVNTGAQSFKGLKNFTNGLQTLNMRVVNDLSTPTKVLGKDANGDVSALTLGTTLSIATGALSANNTTKLWNANKIADYDVLFSTAPLNDQVLTFNGTQWIAKAPPATGVTSVGLSLPSIFNVTTGTVTSSGTLTATLNTQNANLVFAGPATGAAAAPGFRSLVAADIPTLDASKITTGILPLTRGGTGLSAIGAVGNLIRVKDATSLEYFTPSYLDGTNKISIIPGSGVMAMAPSITQTLSTNPAWTISVDSAKNIWNANKIQKNAVIDSLPGDGDVLKWNVTRQLYVPSQDITGGASYGNLTSNDITYADAPDPKYRMKIWASPTSGTVVNGPAGTGAWAWSVLSFQNTGYTTQLYFDKNTLALREWKNNTAAPPPLTAGSNPWYKVVTMQGDSLLGVGGLIFGSRFTDSKSEIGQDSVNLFWDNSSKELGIKTNSPNANLDVNGTAKIGVGGTVLSGIFRATGQTQASIGIGVVSKTFTVTGAAVGGSVIVNPRVDFAANFYILSSRVSSSNTVTVTFNNTSGSAILNRVFDLTVIQ